MSIETQMCLDSASAVATCAEPLQRGPVATFSGTFRTEIRAGVAERMNRCQSTSQVIVTSCCGVDTRSTVVVLSA
jgi:hypothetical protein